MIDDAFTISEQSWGTFVSADANGQNLITALTYDQCLASTRWYLKAKQEGFTEDVITHTGTVDGKL